MATRSTISVLNEDGTVITVYCHWDGGFWRNGPVLQEFYNDETSVRELLAMGNISSLGETLDSSIFYTRDRGEKNQKAATYQSFSDIEAQEFNYLFVPNEGWRVAYHGNEGPLYEEMEKNSND